MVMIMTATLPHVSAQCASKNIVHADQGFASNKAIKPWSLDLFNALERYV
jgi:hypothetical protein